MVVTGLVIACMMAIVVAVGVFAAEPATEKTEVLARFEALRLGAYILDPMTAIYGPYLGWAEAVKYPSRSPKDYRPVRPDVDGWVAALAKAGVQYAFCNAKEAPGFCLWDSKYTDYDVASSDYKTDVLAEFVKACRKYGVEAGFHYCLGPDIYHIRDKGMSDGQYYTFALNQVSELVTRYGPLNRIWWSGGRAIKDRAKLLQEAYDRVKSAQPDCMVVEHHNLHDGKNFPRWPTDVYQPGQVLPTVMHHPLMEHNGTTYYIPYEFMTFFHVPFGGGFGREITPPVAKIAERCRAALANGASATFVIEVDSDGTLAENQIKRLQELRAALKLKDLQK